MAVFGTNINPACKELERNNLPPEVNNHLRPEVGKTYRNDLQPASTSDVSNGSGTRELVKLYCTDPLALDTKLVIEPVSLGKAVSTVQTAKALTVDLSPCDSGINSESIGMQLY